MKKNGSTTRNLLAAGLALAAVSVAGYWLFVKQGRDGLNTGKAVSGTPAVSGAPGGAAAGTVASNAASRSGGIASAGAAKGISSSTRRAGASATSKPPTADQLAAEKMREQLDSGNESEALALARQLIKSGEPDVRSETIVVLGWIGVKALPELSSLLADKDKTVAEEAFREWQVVVDEISDDSVKSQMLVAGMTVIEDVDSLEELVMSFNDLPDELAVRDLAALAQSENALAAKVAREHYEFVTGEPFTTAQAAEAWIKQNRAEQESAAQGTQKKTK